MTTDSAQAPDQELSANLSTAASGARSDLLVAEGLCKYYGSRQALRGLSFSLKAGSILGFLGPNGAGKTTAIRILTTMLEPDEGHFVVDGISREHPEKIRRKIGVLPEGFGLPKQMTGTEYLTFFGQLYGRSAAAARSYGLTLLEEVGMQQRARSLIGTYSHGMRQRLGIARALVNDPVVLFLDEPTLGLDPRGQQELLGLVRRIAQGRNVGVILCSHLLSEIEGTCDDVVILSSGQVVAKGSVNEVIGGTERNVIRIRVPSSSVPEAQRVLEAVPIVMRVSPSDGTSGWLRVEISDKDLNAPPQDGLVNNRVLKPLLGAEIPILSFEPEGGRLRDVFLNLTTEVIK